MQTAVATIIQLTEQKERTTEELKETRAMYASVTDEFQTTVSNLKELLEKEENRYITLTCIYLYLYSGFLPSQSSWWYILRSHVVSYPGSDHMLIWH